MTRRPIDWMGCLIAALAISSPAAAQGVTLTAPDGANILVWQDSKSLHEGLKLIGAGVHREHPELVARLLSCRASGGSKAVVTDGGFFSSDILVTSGRSAGCRGTIDNTNIAK